MEKFDITLTSPKGIVICASTTEGVDAALNMVIGFTYTGDDYAGHMSHTFTGEVLATVQNNYITSVSTDTMVELVRRKIARGEWTQDDMVETIMTLLRSGDPINQQTACKLSEMWDEVEHDMLTPSMEDVVLRLLS